MLSFDPRSLRCELLDVLDAAVVVVEPTGKIVFATERAAAILDAGTADALLDRCISELLAPLEALQAPTTHDRSKLRLPHDENTIIGYRTAALGEHPSTTHLAIVFQDITAWETLREERDRLMRLAAVSEVLPSILHELKNPLAAIGTAVEVLIEESVEDTVRGDLHSVLTEIRRMSLTLEGIGSVGRGLTSHRFAAVDHALLETANVLKRQAEERGVRVECDVPTLPLLPFDVATIRAILFNLLTNAIHACSSGAVIRIAARLLDDGKRFQLTVQDTGKGMPPQVVARCRDLFYTTKPRGTGIGLALCERAVKSIEGRLDVESEPGRGTCIRIDVPVVRPRQRGFRSAARSACT